MHRNTEFFKGPTFQEDLEKALEDHQPLVATREPKTLWKEPSLHDIYYAVDPISGQRLFYPSGVPDEPSLGLPEPEDIADRIRRQLQGKAILDLARELGADTPEEANDFQVEEGQDKCPFSGFEYSEQDEANDDLRYAEHQKLLKEKEEKEAKAKKRQDYEDLVKEFGPQPTPTPDPAQE